MDFLSLSLRMAQSSQGAIFSPYVIEGCSDDDFTAISNAFLPYVRPKVDSMYNNWEVIYLSAGAGYMVRRATWADCKFFDNRESLIAFIHAFYADRQPEPGSPNAEKLRSKNNGS